MAYKGKSNLFKAGGETQSCGIDISDVAAAGGGVSRGEKRGWKREQFYRFEYALYSSTNLLPNQAPNMLPILLPKASYLLHIHSPLSY